MTLAHHDRYAYSALPTRPTWQWPGERSLAVYLGINLECFAFGEGLGAQLAPAAGEPDVLNFAWRDYGNRVGVWRMLDLLDEHALPATVLTNSLMYRQAPGVVEAFRRRGDEIAAHGRSNAERQADLDESGEARLIDECTRTISEQEGCAPTGWLGPWISQSRHTPDLLQEAGYDYLLDWCHDDQPVWMQTRHGRILSVPYPQELNDIPQIIGRKKEGREFADMVIDGFDQMLHDSRKAPLVMGIALHPYLMGQAHRLPHLARLLAHLAAHRNQIWLTTAGRINTAYRALPHNDAGTDS